MNRFQVITEQHGPHLVYVLRDTDSGASARIVPSLGGNCLELRLPPTAGAEPVAVIDDLKSIDEVASQPSRYGIPVLYPWPSGISGGEYQFRGKAHALNKPGEKSIRNHGFVKTARWRVLRSDCDNTGAWLTCAIASADCGELAQAFAARCTLEITWKLTPEKFVMLIKAQNIGTTAMPMGFGLHPYFAVPFGPKGSRAECRLHADVGRQWDLASTFKIGPDDPAPAKPFLDEPEFATSASGGTALDDVAFNHVYETVPVQKSGESTASLIDPANDVKLTVSADRSFGTWVFFSPKGRDAMALEPWTLTANGFNLGAKGLKEAGLIELEPGEEWSGTVEIACGRV